MTAQSVTTAAAREEPSSDGETLLRLRSFSAFPEASEATPYVETDQRIADWVRSYLMRPHPELGRLGAVCPYTPTAARLDAIRVGSSPVQSEAAIHCVMSLALAAFEAIECPPGHRHFRTVVVGFPNCGDEGGRTSLKKVQKRFRLHSILGGLMFGLFEPNSPDRGLLNPEFRPLRSPLPLLAIRMLVDGDAPFVVRNPLLLPIYLCKFPLIAPRRLWAALR